VPPHCVPHLGIWSSAIRVGRPPFTVARQHLGNNQMSFHLSAQFTPLFSGSLRQLYVVSKTCALRTNLFRSHTAPHLFSFEMRYVDKFNAMGSIRKIPPCLEARTDDSLLGQHRQGSVYTLPVSDVLEAISVKRGAVWNGGICNKTTHAASLRLTERKGQANSA
jgi:hypothetical protein